ncbi:M23 family metallopeptidase [Humitalea sp. 24SJ18S-53]|uniref:M23 family metallopeptidase n=1 Tax=Humitalea sp. 24SJ18S-53 TaxID=3422307 RepID=UPI003D66E261
MMEVAMPFFVLEGLAKTLSSFSKACLFMPLAEPVLREDDIIFDLRFPKSAGHLASWKSATFGHVRAGGARVHQGWDFFAMSGTICFAVSGGWVAKVYESKDYGQVLVLRLLGLPNAPAQIFAAYAHLSKVTVAPGQFVKGGEAVAESGMTGNAKEFPRYPHLHFEFRSEPRPGQGLAGRIDPAKIFGDPQDYRPRLFHGDAVTDRIARAARTG